MKGIRHTFSFKLTSFNTKVIYTTLILYQSGNLPEHHNEHKKQELVKTFEAWHKLLFDL